MTHDLYREEIFYFTEASLLSEAAIAMLKTAIKKNYAVGTITGYYDDALSILSVSENLMDNLGYTYEEFRSFTKGSLKLLFHGENKSFLESSRFPKIHGMGEGEMLTKDGTPVTIRMIKEDSLMTIFEKSSTWDELIKEFVENYVCEEYKEEVKQFYDRAYLEQRLREINGELSLECSIVIEGEKRWVRNVVFRGEAEESDYALIFLRDITDAKNEAEIQK